MKGFSGLAISAVAAFGLAGLSFASQGCEDEETVAEVGAPLCDAGDGAFVREATLALLGRRPLSAREVEIGQARIAELESENPGEGRRLWALALMDDPRFVDRWSSLLQDNLNVPRVGVQAMTGCYGATNLADDDRRARLAEFVRDNAAIDGTFDDSFTFADLARGAIVIDDLMPAYRAHLFALLTNLNACGNVDEVGQELAFREEIGHVFESAFLNRDPVCLACHTTTFSVTNNSNPTLDRHWPIEADVETAVFGKPNVADPRVPRAVFRVSGFLGGGTSGFPEYDGTTAYCFDAVSNELLESVCLSGTATCADGGQSFCLSPFDSPTCEGEGERGVCADTPFCVNAQFAAFDVLTCVGGTPTCAATTPYPFCGSGTVAPYCDASGVAVCPPSAGGDGGGNDDGPPPGSFQPWGADKACGIFAKEIAEDDIAEIDARFASIEGRRASVALLEQSLRRGADSLHRLGLVVNARGAVENPDEGFAWLVSMNIVDNVFREVIGTPLTISTRYPRNAAQRELLQSLTRGFVEKRYSLKHLLADIVTSRYFNLRSPESGCAEAYAWPAVFDPWVLAEPEAEKRKNASSDALHSLSARTLLSAAYAALDWPHPKEEAFPESNPGGDLDPGCFDLFPDCPSLEAACASGECCREKDALCTEGEEPLSEAEVQRGIGVFLGISEKGFRGMDFQARLFFEARFGSCVKPTGVKEDAIDRLISDHPDAPLEDLVGALKDRFVGDAWIDPEERNTLKELFGVDLTVRASDVTTLESGLRTLCGALLASPQFQLMGIGLEKAEPPNLLPTRNEACSAERVPGCQ